ncbi:MAG: hypothetical protein ACYC3H_01630 [Bellilinea sp.]
MSQQTALGISVGDVIKTGYGSGPYLVEQITDPQYWSANYLSGLIVWPYPVISLVCAVPVTGRHRDKSYINFIHQDGDRWFTDMGDEILIVSRGPKTVSQLDIFALFEPERPENPRSHPYETDPQVDYSDRSRVFHCTKCGHDFNGVMWNGGFTCPYCPFCLANGKHNVSVKIFFMPAVIPGQNYPSAYQVSMGYIEPWKELLEVTHGRQ